MPVEAAVGFEPTPSGVEARRSVQLSHAAEGGGPIRYRDRRTAMRLTSTRRGMRNRTIPLLTLRAGL